MISVDVLEPILSGQTFKIGRSEVPVVYNFKTIGQNSFCEMNNGVLNNSKNSGQTLYLKGLTIKSDRPIKVIKWNVLLALYKYHAEVISNKNSKDKLNHEVEFSFIGVDSHEFFGKQYLLGTILINVDDEYYSIRINMDNTFNLKKINMSDLDRIGHFYKLIIKDDNDKTIIKDINSDLFYLIDLNYLNQYSLDVNDRLSIGKHIHDKYGVTYASPEYLASRFEIFDIGMLKIQYDDLILSGDIIHPKQIVIIGGFDDRKTFDYSLTNKGI